MGTLPNSILMNLKERHIQLQAPPFRNLIIMGMIH